MILDIPLKLIVAYEVTTGAIGYRHTNSLLITSKMDMKHFRTTTINTVNENKKNIVLMGRRTWESIGRALQGRINVVLTSTATFENNQEDVIFINNIESDFINYLKQNKESVETIYVIGGGFVYNTFLQNYHKMVDEIIATEYEFLVDKEDNSRLASILNDKTNLVLFNLDLLHKYFMISGDKILLEKNAEFISRVTYYKYII